MNMGLGREMPEEKREALLHIGVSAFDKTIEGFIPLARKELAAKESH